MIVQMYVVLRSNAATKETSGEGRMYAQQQLGRMCPVNALKSIFQSFRRNRMHRCSILL